MALPHSVHTQFTTTCSYLCIVLIEELTPGGVHRLDCKFISTQGKCCLSHICRREVGIKCLVVELHMKCSHLKIWHARKVTSSQNELKSTQTKHQKLFYFQLHPVDTDPSTIFVLNFMWIADTEFLINMFWIYSLFQAVAQIQYCYYDWIKGKFTQESGITLFIPVIYLRHTYFRGKYFRVQHHNSVKR